MGMSIEQSKIPCVFRIYCVLLLEIFGNIWYLICIQLRKGHENKFLFVFLPFLHLIPYYLLCW